jgi:cobalt-precorrin 5A hydrolase
MSQSLGAVAVGMGCDRGTPLATLVHALDQALAGVGASRAQVKACASISLKADEPAMLALGLQEGWVITFYEPAQLARVTVPNPSETVRKYTGTPSVSEAAALLAAAAVLGQPQALPVQALLVEKFKHRGADGRSATVSLARCDHFFNQELSQP